MFQRMRFLVGPNIKSLPPSKGPRKARRRPLPPPNMLGTVHEISIYVHRFHNLDLFQQGWYQLKISVRWENSIGDSIGTPSRVVQYEAPGTGTDDMMGVWKIDDSDLSFSTQPFKVKYARQDVLLSVMVSFSLAIGKYESPLSSPVVLKFELMYAPIVENGTQDFLDAELAAVHEFRIPPKALLGLHCYCPVHFDAFHSVLVDLSIHVAFLKAGTSASKEKVISSSQVVENTAKEHFEAQNYILGQGWSSKAIALLKCLLASHEILLEELKEISRAIGQTVDDLHEADLNISKLKYTGSSTGPSYSSASSKNSGSNMGVGQLAGLLHNILEKTDGTFDVESDVPVDTLSKEELMDAFITVGRLLSFLWSTFWNFHRANRISIMEHLRTVWVSSRKAEWSIWMIHSKIEMPHRYLRSGADDTPHRNALGKIVGPWKSSDEPAQTASSRAELHRKSIAQMKINNRSIQDMHIFGDPSRIPVVLVEQHVMNVRRHASSDGSSLDISLDIPDKSYSAVEPVLNGDKFIPKKCFSSRKTGRVLKVVVFVHGFQGHHLDLRLVRNQWLLLDPGAECLMSETNEEKTSGDFREMGSRLADEVIAFLRKKLDRLSRHGGCREIKLSFVGHSIGNIIIRTALTEKVMAPYLKHLYTYMSLSGPHLGYWYSSNSLFNSGMWLLKKLKGAPVIHQLTFSDDPDLQNTFFYWLCKQKTLENFKNIILFSSPQDGYVPYHSARIELCQASSSDQSKKAQIFLEMLNNCLDQIRAPTFEQRVFMRCDVNFDTSTQGRNLDTFIGRAAHIEFLETDSFIKFILWSFPEFFL